jgi:nucleotide-binding universal stress UspA family protein
MILAGAYGHSRLAERIFGGTTRRLLRADNAPALALAH